MDRCRYLFLLLLVSAFLPASAANEPSGIHVSINPKSGTYGITSRKLGWKFSGSFGQPLQKLKGVSGKDSIGEYSSLVFNWTSNQEYSGRIRWYWYKPIVIFSLTTPRGTNGKPVLPFPDFTKLPDSVFHFSYHNRIFPLAQYVLEETSSPWMLFNKKMDACILSPASDFIVSKMTGDGKNHFASGINPEVTQLPAGFTHNTIMVLQKGIRNTWDTWGDALRALYKRKRPANDADTLLKYFGFWTDVGGDYYYTYDTTKGYAGTLLSLKDHYQKEGIPLGYLQLDSWWYQKTKNNVYGQSGAEKKKPEYPAALWNRSGGLWEYKADPQLFPNGLSAFQKELGLPLVTHNRWIDSSSPYHDRYKISGISAIDPGYWKEIMGYLKQSGVIGYEQDWMNYAYTLNPEMISDIKIGNAFTDEMAKAANENGINLQYCMALPRYFMQGVKYNNLTTIRTAGDRFMPKRWMYFLFTSQLAYEMGIWPWSDVFKSREKDNMIVSVLSAGPVGTGDSIGTESKENILLACRQDGVLVKPDLPLLPMDKNYPSMALKEQKPILAYTYTRHKDLQTSYVFAFAEDSTKVNDFSFQLKDIGMSGNTIVFNPANKEVKKLRTGEIFTASLSEDHYQLYIVAPVTASGIAFLGDAGKIAATGKKRIAAISTTGNKLQVQVLFAKGEDTIILQGYAEKRPFTKSGKLIYDKVNKLFTLELSSPSKGSSRNIEMALK